MDMRTHKRLNDLERELVLTKERLAKLEADLAERQTRQKPQDRDTLSLKPKTVN